MLRKNRGQAFGGMWVFPGGRVEEGDGTGLEGARAAAVREADEETGLVLDAADLVPFAHWNPPVEAPRRFATWFFLGGLAHGAADVVVDGGEIGDHLWTTPAAAIERHAAGEVEMVPPTWVTPAAHRRPARRGDRPGRRAGRARSTTSPPRWPTPTACWCRCGSPTPPTSRATSTARAPPPPGHGPGRLALRAVR